MWTRGVLLVGGLVAGVAGVAGAQERGRDREASRPRRLDADVVVKDEAGTTVARVKARSASGGEGVCAYAAKNPLPDTLALAAGVGDAWQLKVQIKDARRRPAVQGVSFAIADARKTGLVTWTAGPELCTLVKGSFDGRDADLTVRCRAVGAPLAPPRTLEARLRVVGCPTL